MCNYILLALFTVVMIVLRSLWAISIVIAAGLLYLVIKTLKVLGV